MARSGKAENLQVDPHFMTHESTSVRLGLEEGPRNRCTMVLFAETDRSFRDALSDTTERVTVTGTTVHGHMILSTPLGKTDCKRNANGTAKRYYSRTDEFLNYTQTAIVHPKEPGAGNTHKDHLRS